MRRAWALALVVLAGCAGQAAGPGPSRVHLAPAGPSSLDYVVFAGMADVATPLAFAGLGTDDPAGRSKVTMHLQ